MIIIDKRIFNRIQKLDPFNNTEYNKMDDLGTSKLFADVNRGSILYNTTAKAWLHYDGIKWCKDDDSMNVALIAKDFAIAYMKYVNGLDKKLSRSKLSEAEKKDEQGRLKCYKRYTETLGKLSVRKTIIEDSRPYIHASQDTFDQQANLFNCRNGVLDLDTGRLLPHSPELMLSKVANVDYNPNARCARFDDFMKEIMCYDSTKIRYLQVLFGYAMSGRNEREEAYILYGKTTRNGKSTLLDTIKYLFGDYGMNIQPESLAEQKKNSRSASGDIARLNGCRLVQMSEPPKSMKLDVALLKALTGRDQITARHLYEREFEFTPVFKLFINTNYLPVVLDDTLFSSERIKVITFDKHFTPEEQDPGLKEALRSPESLSGILNWILRGNRQYRTNPQAIVPPLAVMRATEEYRNNSDKLTQFLGDFIPEKPETAWTCKQLYDAYVGWCKDNNYGSEGKQDFMREIRKRPQFREHGTIDGKTVNNVFLL